MRKSISILFTFFGAGLALVSADPLNSYIQTNLVSDLPGVAAQMDPDLVNPWGIVAGPSTTSRPGTPFWVSDNGTGLSTIYDGKGNKQGLVVSIPPAPGGTPPSAPTGIVFNSVSSSFGGSPFIFSTEDGTIAAWIPPSTAATIEASSPGSIYKGLASGNNGSGDLLYATNFALGRVDVFDSNFHGTTVPGGFTDPNLPAGYAPFNIQNIGGKLYVTYALQDSGHEDDVPGAGHGFVDVFDLNGNLLQRLISQGALNSPWGLAVASPGFGALAGDLLVGNFGDGTIHAYDSSGNLVAALNDVNGKPVMIPGLWGLSFGNGAHDQGVDTLFFTAGIPGSGSIEDHGLFGTLSAGTPEPQPALLVGGTGLAAMLLLVFRKRLGRQRSEPQE